MVCRVERRDDGPHGQIILFQFRIPLITKQSLRFAPRAGFRPRRVLWLPIRRLCEETRSASTILRATECSQYANAIALRRVRPTTTGDWNQPASEENRARHLSWLVLLRRSSHTPS